MNDKRKDKSKKEMGPNRGLNTGPLAAERLDLPKARIIPLDHLAGGD